jgi:transcription factor SPN1
MRRAHEGPRPGEKGYRYHAHVPQTEAMDYSVRPKLLIDPSEIKAGLEQSCSPQK